MRVAIVAEYYPRRRDPVRGAWAHRQAMAARDAGAEVSVLALERPLPGAAAARSAARGRPGAAIAELRAARRQPRRATLDGIEVEYVRFVSPPRQRSYARWHRWAARPLANALDRLHERPLDLVHAHYALPAGGAALPWTRAREVPLAISVHGGDLLSPLLTGEEARAEVGEVLRSASLVIGNSRAMAERAAALAGGTPRTRVVHPPGEPPPEPLPPKRTEPALVTLGAIDPRKRHADVLEALALLAPRVPGVRWVVIGEGPEREALAARAAELDLGSRVEWTGALPPRQAVAELARCHAMVMPSVDEAFGVAYTEAMACGLPAIGCAGEPGPEEIAALGPGMLLVPARDPRPLAATAEDALARAGELGAAAATTARSHFTLEACGRATLDAYEEVVG
jgi:teichuronic acid biosynthesis glycosyltransferase TuaC